MGRLKYCNAKSCPHLTTKTGPVVEHKSLGDLEFPELGMDIKQNKIILDHGPCEIEFAYDRSCNLSCPSCRREIIMVRGEEKEKILELQKKLQDNFFKDAKQFSVCGSGDAFASPVFRKLLQTVEESQAPNLQTLRILTNGLLVKKYWHTLSDYLKSRIIIMSLSIDASEEKTYLINRRGATWEGIHENLEFISELKKSKKIGSFRMSFVVQQNNFKEMKSFVKMAEGYGADYVQFQIIEPDFIRDLRYEDYLEEWLRKAIQEKSHPQHQEFLAIIKDEFFDRYPPSDALEFDLPRIDLGPLRDLRNGHDISQYEENREEAEKIAKELKNRKLAELGLLKDIWFENEMHFVEIKSIESVDDTDVARLDNGKTVKWDKDEWVEI